MSASAFSITRLDQVCDIIMGQSPKGESYNNKGVGVPLLNGPTEFGPTYPSPRTWTDSPTKLSRQGDLLFCVRGSTTGRMNWSDQGYCLGRGIGAFRSKFRPKDTRYIYYTLVAALEKLLSLSTGSVFPNLSRADFGNFEIPWPDDKERAAIASILGALDDNIELNRQMNQTLEDIAQAIFKSWFVDFDPVRAKAQGSEPAGISPEIAALFPDRFVDSELGQIPEGWGATDIYGIANVIYGAPFSSKLFTTEKIGLPLLRIRDLVTGDPQVFTTEKHPKGTMVKPGDIVVGMDGEFRVYLWQGPVSWLNQRVLMMAPKTAIPQTYLRYVIAEPMAFYERSKVGTTVIHLSKSDIDSFLLLMPAQPVLIAFGAIADKISEMVVANSLQSNTLAQIRDNLLSKLLSGEIRVKDAEKFVEANL